MVRIHPGSLALMHEYSIAATEEYPILEVAQMFGGAVEMLPERTTSRPAADVDTNTDKIKALGWEQRHTLAEYIAQSKHA